MLVHLRKHAPFSETFAGANTVNTYAKETYLYHTAGLDGRGGSSYIDSVVCRERDVNGGNSGDSTREEKRYYLQNWRNDVVALVKSTGELVERYRYDAYGKPESYTPADLTGNSNGPDGTVAAADNTQFTTAYSGGAGAVSWQTDIGNTAGAGIPDNTVDSGDSSAYGVYYGAGYTGGIGLMSDATVDNRKGLAGYEFDPILAGSGHPAGSAVPLYHVRHRVLNSYAGKWLQKDPLGYHDSMDLYEYCGSDAIDSFDFSGLSSMFSSSDYEQDSAIAQGMWNPLDLIRLIRLAELAICVRKCIDRHGNGFGVQPCIRRCGVIWMDLPTTTPPSQVPSIQPNRHVGPLRPDPSEPRLPTTPPREVCQLGPSYARPCTGEEGPGYRDLRIQESDCRDKHDQPLYREKNICIKCPDGCKPEVEKETFWDNLDKRNCIRWKAVCVRKTE